MAMSKAELKNAFREAASYEFREIPQNDSQIQYEFSASFEERMEKIIKKDRSFFWKFVNTASKRAAVVAVVCMALILTACSVPAIREPIVRFIVEIFDGGNVYDFEGDITDTISQKYEMTFVPDGFTLIDTFACDGGITYTYENESGKKILFDQAITDGTFLSVDNENGTYKIIEVAGHETHLYFRGTTSVAFWIEDVYFFQITSNDSITEETLIKMVESVE